MFVVNMSKPTPSTLWPMKITGNNYFEEVPLAAVPPDFGHVLTTSLSELFRRIIGSSDGSPDPDDKGWLVVLILILWMVEVVTIGYFESRFRFTIATVILMVIICFAPIISTRISPKRVARVVIETLLVIACIAVFSWTQFGPHSIGRWIFYLTAIVLLLEVGSHLVEWHKDDSIARLSQWYDTLTTSNLGTTICQKISPCHHLRTTTGPFSPIDWNS
jgi:hypothetical protein